MNDAEDLVSRLRMDRAARRRGVLVVEGPSDEVVLARAFAVDKRVIFPVRGRVNVLRVAAALLDAPLEGVVCVADRDFDTSEEDWPGAWFLVLYDDADLEAMLVHTEVLDRFLDEWASAQKLAAFGGADDLRRRIHTLLLPLGALRTANATNRWGLDFGALTLADYIEKRTLVLDHERLVARLARGSTVPVDDLRTAAAGKGRSCPHTGRLLTKGRDSIAALTVGLRHAIGNMTHQQVADDFAERAMRRMVGGRDLDGTAFAARLEAARLRSTELGS